MHRFDDQQLNIIDAKWKHRSISSLRYTFTHFEMPKACLASTRQIITSSQEKDGEDVYSLLGNKSAVWKYLGFPRKDGAVYKQCRYKIKHSGNKTSLARHLAWQTITCCFCYCSSVSTTLGWENMHAGWNSTALLYKEMQWFKKKV